MNKLINGLTTLLLCIHTVTSAVEPKIELDTKREQSDLFSGSEVYSHLINWNKNYSNNTTITKEDVDCVILEYIKKSYDLTPLCTTPVALFFGISAYVLITDTNTDSQKKTITKVGGYISGFITAIIAYNIARNALQNKKATDSYFQTHKNRAYIVFDKENNNWKARYHQDYKLPAKVQNVTQDDVNQIAQEIITSHESEEHVPSDFLKHIAAHIFNNK